MSKSTRSRILVVVSALGLLALAAVVGWVAWCQYSKTPVVEPEEHKRLVGLLSKPGQYAVGQLMRENDRLVCFLGRLNFLPTENDTHGYSKILKSLRLPEHWLVADGHWTLIFFDASDQPRIAELNGSHMALREVPDLCLDAKRSFTVELDRSQTQIADRVLVSFH